MCGIAGRFSFDGSPIAPDLIRRMIDTIRHRGPDGDGFRTDGQHALGHARLAIIDLSDDGLQPMPDESGTLWLVFNGEIYNYRELTRELTARGHVFRSRTDSEVLLHAYQEWGNACLDHLRGMWAFALWDTRAETMFCARDRFGIKPFYYALNGCEILFASEIKAIAGVRPDLRVPNQRWLLNLVVRGRHDDSTETAFTGVRQLGAGEWMRIDRSGVRIARYWDARSFVSTGSHSAASLRQRLDESVRLHLRSDVPVGTCLSGGIDSSAIACLLTRERGALGSAEAISTFSAVYRDRIADESAFIDSVNSHMGARSFQVEPRGEDLPDILPRITWFQDEPSSGPGLYPQWHVMRLAHGHVKVLLDGQGADEILAGYHDYVPRFLAGLVAHPTPRRVWQFAREVGPLWRTLGYSPIPGVARHLLPEEFGRRRQRQLGTESWSVLTPGARAAAMVSVERTDNAASRTHLGSTLIDALTRETLPALLHYEDRNSMAFSIEARVPFLDHRLVEYCLTMPDDARIRHGLTKWALRQAVADVLPPDVLARRDKKGYPTPSAHWFRTTVRDWTRDVLFDPKTRARGLFDTAAIEAKLAQHQSGKSDHSWQIWRWLTIELWHRHFIDSFSPLSASG